MLDEQKKKTEDNKVAEKTAMFEEALASYENYHKKTNKDKVTLPDYKAMLKFCLHVIPEETSLISHFKNKAEVVAKLKEINWEPHLVLLVEQRAHIQEQIDKNTPPQGEEATVLDTATIEENSEEVGHESD